MTKNLLLLFVLACSLSTVSAQERTMPKLSPLTQLYLYKTGQPGAGKILPEYVYKQVNNVLYISALIKTGNGLQQEDLNLLGVKVGTKAGNIWTTQIPADNLEAFTKVSGIEYIQLDEPAFPLLDSARKTTRVDSVHGGYGLPMPYTGDGVVMGIVDAGFDYTHPTMYDTSGVAYRVKKVWEQKTSGTPPAGFIYGNEMTDSVVIRIKGTDLTTTPHGTHVCGIAAGGGFGSLNNNNFRGVAYRSDLVFVGITPDQSQWINTGISDMIDGINYVYTYATSVSKPAVVNLSWGSPLGPHDGSGLFSQALDNLTGPGRIFVCAAGNNGTDNLHVNKTFTTSDTLVHSILGIATSPIGKRTWVDIWGDTAKTFCVKVSLTFGASVVATTGFVCLDNSIHHFYLVGSNSDTCFVDMTTSTSEFNLKPRVFLNLYCRASNAVDIAIKGTDGHIDMWNSYVYQTTGYYGSFTSNLTPGAVAGNVNMTISDIASTRSAITVGAYASKTEWTDLNNASYNYNSYVAKGNLVPFSSHGPTTDGRIKPDITGPGMTVGSAISSYDTSFNPGGSEAMYNVISYHNPQNNRNYTYGMLSGTSMASPAVSGIVALMLQAKPILNPQAIKDIMVQTAIKDNFTGTIPAGGNVTWGNGKVNAYGSVMGALAFNDVKNTTTSFNAVNLYPNPSTGYTTISVTSDKAERIMLTITDLAGNNVQTESWSINKGYNSRQFDFKHLAKGVYFAKLASATKSSVIKMVLE